LLTSNNGLSHVLSLVFVTAYLATLTRLFRATNPLKIEVWAMGFVILSLILCSKVFSGEYLIWLMPFAMRAGWQRHWGIVACYAVALMILRLVYREWDAVIGVEPAGTLLITAKNSACVAMICTFAREICASTRNASTSASAEGSLSLK
jgi:hypothetical protein